MTARPAAALFTFTFAAMALAAILGGEPTATPTPAAPPRLSGGFGRTPVSQATPQPRGGQSLQDVVRAASETKQGNKETPRPAVAITNQTLVTDPNRGRLTTWQGPTRGPSPRPAMTPGASARGAAAAAAAPPETPTAAAPDAESTQEAHWKETARHARERVAQDRERVTQLEAETRKLENDFYSWDDGLYRDNVIKPAWDKKREELDTAKLELEAAEKDLEDLPEKARKGGALPGWIRE